MATDKPGKLKKTVVLVGMMGAGKTAVGKALAARLSVPFLDSDTEIEKAANTAGLPLGGVALAKSQADALFARGYRIITGFDVLWLRERTDEMRGWTNS